MVYRKHYIGLNVKKASKHKFKTNIKYVYKLCHHDFQVHIVTKIGITYHSSKR